MPRSRAGGRDVLPAVERSPGHSEFIGWWPRQAWPLPLDPRLNGACDSEAHSGVPLTRQHPRVLSGEAAEVTRAEMAASGEDGRVEVGGLCPLILEMMELHSYTPLFL